MTYLTDERTAESNVKQDFETILAINLNPAQSQPYESSNEWKDIVVMVERIRNVLGGLKEVSFEGLGKQTIQTSIGSTVTTVKTLFQDLSGFMQRPNDQSSITQLGKKRTNLSDTLHGTWLVWVRLALLCLSSMPLLQEMIDKVKEQTGGCRSELIGMQLAKT